MRFFCQEEKEKFWAVFEREIEAQERARADQCAAAAATLDETDPLTATLLNAACDHLTASRHAAQTAAKIRMKGKHAAQKLEKAGVTKAIQAALFMEILEAVFSFNAAAAMEKFETLETIQENGRI